MQNQTFGGLMWSTRAGVLAQALTVADARDRAQRRRTPVAATRQPRSAQRRPAALSSLVSLLAGCAIGAALVATLTA